MLNNDELKSIEELKSFKKTVNENDKEEFELNDDALDQVAGGLSKELKRNE